MNGDNIEKMLDKIICCDCFEGFPKIPNESIDMILCDLPYGQTRNEWDKQIPMLLLWGEYKRIAKPNAAIVLFAQGMFTAELMTAQPSIWHYNLVWVKNHVTGFLNANKMPLRQHEDILVFYKDVPVYNPQGVRRCFKRCNRGTAEATGDNYGNAAPRYNQNRTGYPGSLLYFDVQENKEHPTQKPLKLFEYLIKTYTNPGAIVLDNCIGSGTTAEACMSTGRHFIGFEKNPEYVKLANKRIHTDHMKLSEFEENKLAVKA